ncbi:uncharacterized protein PFL1_06858 [Pseudozyma flocculosa PF-1]|uniref:N-acetyltransferase domain-containing protein n=2 Tax=Pseudozyma flocculosa TaxID=84751 RepID=A0A5C3EZN9_9BASI|nr:uncharacterized protein PFL1_06858 [Pseudozyma flocculosa PF-1]EPQ29952.1 hypothetical protein PFL1_06858 [Pseudozyma flocculosa PF-1]SPO37265.1 uncharacterized protein PSFLO_02737 [Pseudozyma flocculosa]
MGYRVQPATASDSASLARIEKRAFNDPNNAADELGRLLATDPLTASIDDEEKARLAVQRFRAFFDDADFVVVKVVQVPDHPAQSEGEGEGERAEAEAEAEAVAFSVWIRPVLGGIKTRPCPRSDEQAKKDEDEDDEETKRRKKDALWARFSAAIDRKREEVMGTRPHWFLKLLCVDPAHQRRGVGTMLLDWGLQRAMDNADEVPGPFSVYLESSPAGEGAYVKAGFKVMGHDRIDEPRAQRGYLQWPYMIRSPPAPVCQRGLHRGANRAQPQQQQQA